jgi:hypothetical protein
MPLASISGPISFFSLWPAPTCDYTETSVEGGQHGSMRALTAVSSFAPHLPCPHLPLG